MPFDELAIDLPTFSPLLRTDHGLRGVSPIPGWSTNGKGPTPCLLLAFSADLRAEAAGSSSLMTPGPVWKGLVLLLLDWETCCSASAEELNSARWSARRAGIRNVERRMLPQVHAGSDMALQDCRLHVVG